jgi:hypothetical protein
MRIELLKAARRDAYCTTMTHREEYPMKTYLPTVLLLTSLGAAFAVSAAEGLATAQERCFQAHAQVMEKPGLRNLSACWHAHGYLMGAR